MTDQIVIYLLHFAPKFRHAGHYLGSTAAHCFDRRMQEHMRGSGSKLVWRASQNGSEIYVARLWRSHSRELERTIKDSSHLPRYCPICTKKLEPDLTTCARLVRSTLVSGSSIAPLGF